MSIETKEDVDKIIAKRFPEYAAKAVDIAWEIIYPHTKTPKSADLYEYKTGAISIKLNAIDDTENACEVFGIRRGKNGSLLVFQKDMEAPTNGYWRLLGKVETSGKIKLCQSS